VANSGSRPTFPPMMRAPIRNAVALAAFVAVTGTVGVLIANRGQLTPMSSGDELGGYRPELGFASQSSPTAAQTRTGAPDSTVR
jgi:hypothetical protein